MNSDILKIAVIIGLPVLVPPLGYYFYGIPPTYILGAIIALYLPIWWKLTRD